MAVTSFDVTCDKKRLKSPYLTGDKVQVVSRVTEKTVVRKKTLGYVSSFPLAVNIYKASSDEFKSLKKANRKNKKSVLTLPNAPSVSPQICTVSEMNDSEYNNRSNDTKSRIKKRKSNVRRPRYKSKDYAYYDRDARYCSQFNINLDSSSTDLLKKYKYGDKSTENCSLLTSFKSSFPTDVSNCSKGTKPHDVWGVLRNMNRFQFNPSPPMSEESIILSPKKRRAPKKRVKCKDTRFIETCRTEEFAYISSYAVDSSNSLAQSSSFDRITVINKHGDFNTACKGFGDRSFKASFLNEANQKQLSGKKKNKKANGKKGKKAICPAEEKENVKEVNELKDNTVLKTSQDKMASIIVEPETNNIDSQNKAHEYSENSSICSINKINNNKKYNNNMCGISSDSVRDGFALLSNAGSSKAAIAVVNKHIVLNEKNPIEKSFNRRILQSRKMPGDTGVKRSVSNNPIPLNPQINEIQKRKPRLVTTMPSACMTPKLTQHEIKRRLALMRFPITILGKDEVRSPVELQNYEFSQFYGLDQSIWPYMKEWEIKKPVKNKEIILKPNNIPKFNNTPIHKKRDGPLEISQNKLKKNNNEMAINKRSILNSDKLVRGNSITTNKITELKKKPLSGNLEDNNKLQQSKRLSSIAQLKDKVLYLLHKKIPEMKINNTVEGLEHKTNKTRTLSATVKTEVSVETNSRKTPVNLTNNNVNKPKAQKPPVATNKKPQSGSRLLWSKAKWTNNFIDNVIKKIKNGVYYNHDHKYTNGLKVTSVKDEIQETMSDEEAEEYVLPPKVTVKKKQDDVAITIPGFDNSLPELEIKTLNLSQISVRHCVTDVMLQFDVKIPTDINKIVIGPKTSSSYIPIEVADSKTKIFKCKTMILNAMLPAELCSIIPKMMGIINMDLKATSSPAFCNYEPIDKAEMQLSPICETPCVEMTKSESLRFISPFEYLSSAIKKILVGRFPNTHRNVNGPVVTKIIPKLNSEFTSLKLLPNIYFKELGRITYKINSLLPSFLEVQENIVPVTSRSVLTSPVILEKSRYDSTALELYTTKNKHLAPAYKPYDMVAFIGSILKNTIITLNPNCMPIINAIKIQYCGTLLKIEKISDKLTEKNLLVTITHPSNTPLKLFSNNTVSINQNNSTQNCIEYIKRSSDYCLNKKHSEMEFKTTHNKNKRKGFYKLYRKCKSTSSITTTEKCINTPLSKIKTLDDFFQIIGSKKGLSSVFDEYAARKILSSIGQMKNWITEINPKQALLIILLTNKKDTPNLVRYRPILLQGIAVNRITRSSELDMEIEVIERENLHKLPQYEGITYSPDLIENNDQLLEELYWIAKTTASDYQRPFDETSEKLLKDLLQKRKKLNPSYLRVMARYVGLGLLKPLIRK